MAPKRYEFWYCSECKDGPCSYALHPACVNCGSIAPTPPLEPAQTALTNDAGIPSGWKNPHGLAVAMADVTKAEAPLPRAQGNFPNLRPSSNTFRELNGNDATSDLETDYKSPVDGIMGLTADRCLQSMIFEQARDLTDWLMNVAKLLFDKRTGVTICAGYGVQGGSSSNDLGQNLPSNNHYKSGEVGGDEENGSGSSDGCCSGEETWSNSLAYDLFACIFYKRNRNKCSGHRFCAGPGFPTISDLR